MRATSNSARGNRWSRKRLVAAVPLVLAVLVAPALAGGGNSPVQVRVLETGDRIVLAYTFGDCRSTTVNIGGTDYQELSFQREAVMLQAGAPGLPKIGRSVIIPDNAEMGLRVQSANYYEIAANIAPSKGNLLRDIDPADVPYTFGNEYSTNAFFPANLAEMGSPYILRDYRGSDILVYPFQYNPVTRVLRVYTDITIEIYQTGPGQINVLDPAVRSHGLSLAFDELYQIHFLNYVRDRYAPLNETGGMLIIVNDAWAANIQPLADWKNSVGIPTTVVNISTIGNSASSIKNYIQGVYDQGGLSFVLLVGDSAQVTPGSASGGDSDAVYSKLAGDDDYPEIMVGRFSAESAANVDTQVLRTVEYEQMPATQQTWFWQGTGIASSQGAGQGDDGEADYQHIGNIRTQLLAGGYTLVDEIYDPGATAAEVTDALNAGRGIVNYCGHGDTTLWSTTGFSNSNVNSLQNDNMLPFIFSVACLNGDFKGQTCFAEAWTRATHNGEPTGAIGAYMSTVLQSWAPPMEAQDEFNSAYLAQTYHGYGTLCYAGSCAMMQKYGGAGVEMFDTWIVFADPSLRIVGVVTPPHGLVVKPKTGLASQGPRHGPFTPASMDFTLENKNATPLQYEVTKTQRWLSITNPSGTLDGGQSVVVTVTIEPGANYLPDGVYNDTVTFTNLTDHDGDATRSATLQVGTPAILYDFPLDANPGWSVQAQWAFGHPTGQGGSHGYPDPNNGATGTNVFGVNLNGDYALLIGGPYYLKAGPFDLSHAMLTELKFMRWLNSDEAPLVTNTVDVSNDGATWTNLWTSGSDEMWENAWSQQSYSLSAVADLHAAVYVRWGYQLRPPALAFSGWNVDDVQIWGLTGHPLGDLNCDDGINAFDIDAFVLAITSAPGFEAYYDQYPNCEATLADINLDGSVNAFDIDPFVDLLIGG